MNPTSATLRRHTAGYNFIANRQTGVTFRWGRTMDEDPECAPWPELADISISNRCDAGCAYCYRDSRPDGQLMSVDEYALVLDALTHAEMGPVFQVALGGGEPLQHPAIVEILRMTAARGIIPNYTTNGMAFTPEILDATAESCGAIAISYDPHRDVQLARLADEAERARQLGIRVNLHFVLSSHTLAEATDLLLGRADKRYGAFDAIVFLTYKPTGRADGSHSIVPSPELDRFLAALEANPARARVGFDACFVPTLISRTRTPQTLIDSCEGGFFSVYVDENLVVSPCSFATDAGHRFSLRDHSFDDIWLNGLTEYRESVRAAHTARCAGCVPFDTCRGSCPYFDSLHICTADAAGVSRS